LLTNVGLGREESTSNTSSYALRTGTGEVVLLTFASDYGDDGSPRCVTFRYRSLPNP
jgi:hypothetical protein